MISVNDVLNSAGMFLVAKDKNLNFAYCNENFAMALGLDSPQQIVGKNDYDFFDEYSISKYHSGDINVMRGGTYINVLEKQKRLDEAFENLITKTPLKNKCGETTGVVISFLTSQNFANHINAEVLNLNSATNKYEFYINKEKIEFSQKEYSIFKLILIGNTAKQIGGKLCISYRTAEDYINRIKFKLQCSHKAHIAEAAQRFGILNQYIKL